MPDWDVIPVGFSGQRLMPDSIEVAYSDNNNELAIRIVESGAKRFQKANYINASYWSSIHELIIYAWAACPKYDRVLICEYDVFQNCPLYEFFEEPNTDVVWCSHATPEESDKKTFPLLYKELNPEAATSAPVKGKVFSCGTLFQLYTGDALEKLHVGIRENQNLYKNCFCELVLGIESRINNLDIGLWEVKNKDPITDYFRPSKFRSDKVNEMKKYDIPLWTHPDKE